MNTLAEIQRILSEQLALDPAAITPKADLKDDLKADSLDVVQVAMAVEETFAVEVEDDAVGGIVTVADLVAYVDKLLAAK